MYFSGLGESVNANATIGILCDDQFYNDIDLN